MKKSGNHKHHTHCIFATCVHNNGCLNCPVINAQNYIYSSTNQTHHAFTTLRLCFSFRAANSKTCFHMVNFAAVSDGRTTHTKVTTVHAFSFLYNFTVCWIASFDGALLWSTFVVDSSLFDPQSPVLPLLGSLGLATGSFWFSLSLELCYTTGCRRLCATFYRIHSSTN